MTRPRKGRNACAGAALGRERERGSERSRQPAGSGAASAVDGGGSMLLAACHLLKGSESVRHRGVQRLFLTRFSCLSPCSY